MTTPPTGLDPITLEIVNNALSSIADEMALMIMRSAYSPVVRDTMDYSTALCDRNGKIVAQGLTLAVQLGTFPSVMKHVIEAARTAEPGDIFVTNDPYSGGQHLPDIYIVKPIFLDGRIEGYAATMAHHSDVGGLTPGSVAVHAREIYQEGLRIPLVKLYEGGEQNSILFSMIQANTRLPIDVIGDIRAQVAACRAGERGLVELVERYGRDASHRYMDQLQLLAERLMRAEIDDLEDGVYSFQDYLDGFGEDPEPICLSVTVSIRGNEVEVDFSGSSAQVPAALNAPAGFAQAACYCAFRGIAQRDIPNAEGYMKPIRIKLPSRTIVNPELPAACGARGVVGYRVYETVMGALAQVAPAKVVAPGEGGPSLIMIGGYADAKPYVLSEVLVGCWGARSARDGLEGVSNPLANLSNQPIELLEKELPLRVLRYGLVPDSGGPGRFRGGLAFARDYEVLGDDALLTVRADRRSHRPYGFRGGHAGGASSNEIIDRGGARVLPVMPMEAFSLKHGDVFRHTSAGGGGFGPPHTREPQAVREDILDGKVTPLAAAEIYGIVVGDGPEYLIDEAATSEVRARLAVRATDAEP